MFFYYRSTPPANLAAQLMKVHRENRCKGGKNQRLVDKLMVCSIQIKYCYRDRGTIDVESCAVSKRACPKTWLPELKLLELDKEAILCPTGWLTDSIINAVQCLLKKQFPNINGFQDTCLGSVYNFKTLQSDFIQILFSPGHWLTISTMGLIYPSVAVFDSKYNTASTQVSTQIASILCTNLHQIKLQFMNIQLQVSQLL